MTWLVPLETPVDHSGGGGTAHCKARICLYSETQHTASVALLYDESNANNTRQMHTQLATTHLFKVNDFQCHHLLGLVINT